MLRNQTHSNPWYYAAMIGLIAAGTTVAQESAKPVAMVNRTPITKGELDASFRQSRISEQAEKMPIAEVNKIKLHVLQLLINRTLLNQYLDELKIKVDERLVAEHVQKIRERLSSQNQTLDGLLQKLGMSEEQMRTDIRNDYRWVAYVESQAKESVLRKYYQENVEAFDGSQVHVRHILIKAPEDSTPEQKELARRRATDLRARIAKGEAFDALAQQYSDCPSRDKGGELPMFRRKGVMTEPFAKAAFALKESELSQVVETEFGYHLIYSIEKKPGAKPVTFEEAADDVKSFYAEDLRKAVVARLRQKADMKIMFPKQG
jgi:parvulin-like peptidyl-prolyl isomerase